MTRLTTLRSRLTALRNARAGVRLATAFAAFVTAVLVALAAVFFLDLFFELQIPQRLVVLLSAAGGVYWAFHKFTKPFLGVNEDLEQMALLVERRKSISSDLVAALQFESKDAPQWGSARLQTAVIDDVSFKADSLDVFDGFDRSQLQQRGLIAGSAIAVAIIASVLFPQYLSVFANRLLLGSQHYPTRTQIAQVMLNSRLVLADGKAGSRPIDIRAPQGAPLTFFVKAAGVLPKDGKVQLVSTGVGGGKSAVELVALSTAERLERLQKAAAMLQAAQADAAFDTAGPWRDEVLALLAFDAPQVAAAIPERSQPDLPAAAEQLTSIINAWPADAEQFGVLTGQLPRLVDNVTYQLQIGDAWTDPAGVSLIPLPVVQPQLTAVPPDYAKSSSAATDAGGRQAAALEGTQLTFAVACTNNKKLTDVWLNVKSKAGNQRFDLKPAENGGLNWSLPVENTPFAALKEELTYELQVTDIDQLHLESPIRGQVRLRPDRSPSVTGEIIHKVVLPGAEPVIDYRATDDYGIAGLRVKVEVERAADAESPAEVRSSDDLTPGIKQEAETAVVPVLPAGKAITGTALPVAGKYALKLNGLQLKRGPLQKGDRLKLVLEAVDYRGEKTGTAAAGEPLLIEISDESGVLAAISEADLKSEERLNDIIKRQLGIGESP